MMDSAGENDGQDVKLKVGGIGIYDRGGVWGRGGDWIDDQS